MFDYERLYKFARAVSDEVRAKVSLISCKCCSAVILHFHDFFQNNNFTAHRDYGFHHGLSCWSPVINILRDPRWGRNQVQFLPSL